MLCFRINPINSTIIGTVTLPPGAAYNTRDASAWNGKPYLVPVNEIVPAAGPDDVVEGPFDSYDGTSAVRTYAVRAKTPEELAAELDTARRQRVAVIRTAYNQALADLHAAYPQSEIDTWPIQEAEAVARAADPAAPAPFLESLAAHRGVPVADLITRVIDKAATYKASVSAALGQRQALEDAIAQAPTVADVQAVFWV